MTGVYFALAILAVVALIQAIFWGAFWYVDFDDDDDDRKSEGGPR